MTLAAKCRWFRVATRGQPTDMHAPFGLPVAMFVIVLLAGHGTAWPRTWTDRTGKYRIEAERVEIQSEAVVLKASDGKSITVRLNKLSDEDRRYIASLRAAERRKAATTERKDSAPSARRSSAKLARATALARRRDAKLNSRYALLVRPAKKVKAEYEFRVTAPNLQAKEWIIYGANPPRLIGQKSQASLIPPGSVVEDLENPRRSLLTVRIPVTDKALQKQVTAKLRIDAQLFERRLVPRDQFAGNGDPPKLEEGEPASCLLETRLINFKSQQFQQWLDDQQLRRSPKEGQIDFARRVFLMVRKNFTYTYTSKMDRQASSICRAGTSDCGGLSITFTSVMRESDVPCRLIVGRWAKSANKDEIVGEVHYYQEHVKAEFYADGVGWVPVDLSMSVLHDKTSQGLTYFGHDKGDFIIMHVDHDLTVDTVDFGRRTIPFLQGVTYWVSGTGSLDGSSYEQEWTVF